MPTLADFGESELLSVREAADLLGVSRRTLERLVASKLFPRPLKIGARSLYLVKDVNVYVERLKQFREQVVT